MFERLSLLPLQENEKPSKYVKQIPPPLKGLGLRADTFFHHDTVPLKGYPYEVRLIRAMQPAAEKRGSKRVLIVDIDDGHINLEWYQSPRRVISVSVAPNNRLHWAALIGTESPRGAARYIDRIPATILDQIARVFEG